MATLLTIPASAFFGDQDAQLVAGDAHAGQETFLGKPALAFDNTDEEAAVSPEFEMPKKYTGTGLKARLHWTSPTTTGDVRLEVYVEAKTPNSDTLNTVTTASWASANAVTDDAPAGAGDPLRVDVTLTNADGVAAGDTVRFGIRRDTDHADDDLADDAYVWTVTIEDDA